MGVAARIGDDVALIGGEPFAARCRMSPEAFTRRRKMPADTLAKTVIARKGRTLKMEIREFARELGMDGGISAPDYLKAREKLNPEALLYLAQHHASSVYADGDCDGYKGMLLVAVDGSTANVPTTPETVARYGDASGHGKGQATLGMSAAFDVINRQLLSLTINRGGFDERAQVPTHLEAIPEIVGEPPLRAGHGPGLPVVRPDGGPARRERPLRDARPVELHERGVQGRRGGGRGLLGGGRVHRCAAGGHQAAQRVVLREAQGGAGPSRCAACWST